MTKSADFIYRQNRPTKICRTSRKNRPILSADKSPDFVGQDRARSIFDDFVGQLFVYRTTNFVCLQWKMNIYFSYLLCLLESYHQTE